MDKENLKRKLPMLTVSIGIALSFILTIRALTNLTLLLVGQFMNYIPVFILFGSPLKPSFIGLITITALSIFSWLFSTKLSKFQEIKWKTVIFLQMIVGITAYYTWYITAPIYNHVVPYLLERVSEVRVVNIWHQVLIGNPDNLMILLVFIPLITVSLLIVWLSRQYTRYPDALKQAFEEYEFSTHRFQNFFKMGETESWPDAILGPDSETKQYIIQPGKDRTLNNVIIGGIGTGKSAALVLPMLNQDLTWMVRFINKFNELYHREDYYSEDISGMYLNGISVIEPSNDLCQKVFKLVKAHGIPEEAVFYIDPTNPNTPSINPMQGPVDQVAEAFAMVIEGLAENSSSGNFFFQQSERNHLKHYIYLLKLHDPDKQVTFDMLLDMYNNPQLVRRMHLKLKETMPKDIDTIEDRDTRNHWKIVQQVDEWFDMNLLPKMVNGEKVQITHGSYRGEYEYYDALANYVQGLRNVLNDIGANKLIRRVLFGKSKFDFDRHLEYGGVLLVNTAKGEMAALSNILGKLILLSLQNAVFRRKPNVSNFHHILVDEFPDYIYRPFKEFPAQSRKYKVIVTVVAQTITQLADKYGETYMHTLLGTMRHKMVFGDIPYYDAKLFSDTFGSSDRFDEIQNEQSISPLQEQPVTRAGSSYIQKNEVILSPSDLIYQEAFQCAVKIVKHNKPMPVRQIDANFVPKEQFIKANVTVNKSAAHFWLEVKENMQLDANHLLAKNSPLEEIEEPREDHYEDNPRIYHYQTDDDTFMTDGNLPFILDHSKPLVNTIPEQNFVDIQANNVIENKVEESSIIENNSTEQVADQNEEVVLNIDNSLVEDIDDTYDPLADILGNTHESNQTKRSELSEQHQQLITDIRQEIEAEQRRMNINSQTQQRAAIESINDNIDII